MTEIQRRLEQFIDEKQWTKAEFARRMDIHPQVVLRYLKGNGKIELLIPALLNEGCDIEWLLTGNSKEKGSGATANAIYLETAPVRLLGRVYANPDGSEVSEDLTEEIYIPFLAYNKQHLFALLVCGDSMIHARKSIFPGDVCVFEVGRQPKNNDIVAVTLRNGQRLVKTFKHLSADAAELRSANNFRNYPAMKIRKKDVSNYGIFVAKVDFDDDQRKRWGIK